VLEHVLPQRRPRPAAQQSQRVQRAFRRAPLLALRRVFIATIGKKQQA
jgi:hypothetical protein